MSGQSTRPTTVGEVRGNSTASLTQRLSGANAESMKKQTNGIVRNSNNLPSKTDTIPASKVPSNIAALLAQRLNLQVSGAPNGRTVVFRFPKSGKGI
jgi:hypothetical protein